MPVSLVLNNTASPFNTISSVTFTGVDTLNTKDNGARLDIELQNPRRKRISTPPPWFNTQYWLDGFRHNASGVEESICNGFITSNSGVLTVADPREYLS